MFLCQLAAGLLLGRLFAWGRPLPPKGSRLRSSPKTEPAAVLLVRSVGSAASSAVNICAFVVLLSAFAEVFSACGLFPLLERGVAFLTRGGIAGEVAHCFFTGLLEICAGSALAVELPPTEAGKILPFLLSFGGLSVCCQVSACFGEEPLPWGKLLWGRLLHGLFTAFLAVPWLKRVVLPAMTGAAVPAFSAGRWCCCACWCPPVGRGGGRQRDVGGGAAAGRRSRPEGGSLRAGACGLQGVAEEVRAGRLMLKCAEGQGIVTGK